MAGIIPLMNHVRERWIMGKIHMHGVGKIIGYKLWSGEKKKLSEIEKGCWMIQACFLCPVILSGNVSDQVHELHTVKEHSINYH